MQIELTAVFQKVPEGYIGFVEERLGRISFAVEHKERSRSPASVVVRAGETTGKEIQSPAITNHGFRMIGLPPPDWPPTNWVVR